MMLQLLWVEHVYVWSSKISKSPQIKDYFYYIGSGSVIHEPGASDSALMLTLCALQMLVLLLLLLLLLTM